MRVLLISCLLLILGLLMLSCQADSLPVEEPAVTIFPASTPTKTVAPSAVPSATPTRPLAEQPKTRQPTSTTIATPEPAWALCSPLAETSLEALSEIVSSPYDPPPMGRDERHQGVDFSYYQRGERQSIAGETVQAILPGRVISVLADRLPYGNMVILETAVADLPSELASQLGITERQSLYHLYAHFQDAPLVELGQQVACGDPLGAVGKTGYNIAVPHLHLELRVGPAGEVFPSMAFYDTRAAEDEMEAYQRWRMSGVFQHFDPMFLIDFYLSGQ